MARILELEDVRIIRGGVEIIKGISASFDEKSVTVILGPSGSGKSTLLKIAAGIIPPDGGRACYRGEDYFHMSEEENNRFRRQNGFVFQDGALWSNRSIYENLTLPLQYHFPELSREEIGERVRESITRIGFQDNPQLRPAQLSGGERKMIGFIRAMITDPELIFMDSPTDNVDSAVAARIRGIVAALKDAGKTLLICTHDRELISASADNIIVLDKGAILSHGPFRDVLTGEDEKVKEIIGSVVDADSILGDDLLQLLSPDDLDL